ncbi:hypothetical protein KSF_052050 [Reticulibacter mediterranei]|uniref:Uncharacterized protein n=1 Tax=Reticulibacter mediterranei TaxID=2778369 RepID=A0A8J3IQL8_9CHLR|nr:hypothetical protein [Reticulibacter mediterranei]GHO95157.1 hypothetical protein KSF_052050 [Reticulibacter mediterranei]
MGLRSILAVVLKGKVLAVVLVVTAIVGGATVAMASTPAEHQLVHQTAILGKTATSTDHQGKNDHGMLTPGIKSQGTATPGIKSQGKGLENNDSQQCAGLPEIQRLVAKFSLSVDHQSDDVEAICSLHDGKFKGTTANGLTISTTTVYGYGEIDQLLTEAQFLAAHDRGNMSGKLTSANARIYLADTLHYCGETPLKACLKANRSDAHSNNNGKNDNSKGKPTSTPTPKH